MSRLVSVSSMQTVYALPKRVVWARYRPRPELISGDQPPKCGWRGVYGHKDRRECFFYLIIRFPFPALGQPYPNGYGFS